MPTSSRFTAAISVCVAVALLAPSSVSAQTDTEISEITELERRRDELTVTIAELETQVEDLTELVDSLDEAIRQSELAVELLADEFERLVDARREPERTHIEIAIAGYMVGDPRRNALLDEFDAIEGADEPERRRQFYSAVMDDAVRRLAEIDEQLRGLAGQVDEARTAASDLVAQRREAAAQREELGGRMTQLALELDEVVSNIELLRSLENKAILTGLPTLSDPTRPALAVKIDNVGSALPQEGINQADVVWEEAVEGGFSRFAAVFHSESPSVVGPVRSMRTSDVDLLEQLNHPLFANSGGNRVTASLVAGSELINIGAAAFADAYYRDTSRRRPANLFANTSSLWAVGASEEAHEIGTPGQPVPLWPYREPDDPPHPAATPASGVDIDFGTTQVSYEWNGNGWARSQNGVAHVDTAGVQVAPRNLIVQFTPYTPSEADPNSPHAITVGSREVWIFMNGTVIVATWRRNESTDPVQFVDGNGQPIPLEPGRTWIALARLDSATLR